MLEGQETIGGGTRTARDLNAAVRRILNLDEDLSGFYALVLDDPDLSWAARGAGRMLRLAELLAAAGGGEPESAPDTDGETEVPRR